MLQGEHLKNSLFLKLQLEILSLQPRHNESFIESHAKNSPAATTIAELMGSESATFFYAHLILKRGGSDKAIPWHQDLPYWKVGGAQIGSVWVALDDMPRAASVQYIKGRTIDLC